MNTTTQTHDSVWENIVDITNRLQKNALTASSVSKLLEVIAEGMLPIEKNDFSVIYQDYGTVSPVFLIADGKVVSKENSDFIEPFSIKKTSIINIIHNAQDKPLYLGTNQECVEHGFPESYKSLLITPLRLKEKKTIGVLLAYSHSQEYAHQQLSTPFNSLSKTITFYLRSNIIRRRNNLFKDFHNGLIRQPHQKEADIISYLVDKLKSWFTHDDINIILINPFNTNKYLLACDKGVVNEDFRKSSSLHQDALNFLVGEMIPEISERPTILNSIKDIKKHCITSGCKSWLGARMHTASDSNIGFIILQNFIAEHSYEIGEEKLVDDVSDFMAVVLTEYRKDQREKSLSSFRDMLLLEKLPSDIELYDKAQKTLNELYGEVPLAIVRTNRITRKLELAKSTIDDFHLDIEFEEKLKIHLEDRLRSSTQENFSIEHPKLKTLLATPMKSGKDDLGCFLIPSAKCGPLTARYIGDLSDMVAALIDKQDKQQTRLSLLSDFGNKVPSIILTNEEIIKVTRKYIAKAMFSENFYIALYNKDKNEISFPFMIINGKEEKQDSRILDKKKMGKTEEIILTGKPILHETKAESMAWYDQTNHEEFIGNPLASWIGVPILSSDGVIGVIAAYHPDEEFVYTQGDLFFLQMLSHPVSGLFRALALEEAKEKIANRERDLRDNWNIQDINHHIGNLLPNVNIILEDVLNEVDKTIEKDDISNLYFLKDKIENITDVIKNSLSTITQIKSYSIESVYLPEILSSVLEEQLIIHDIFNLYVQPEYFNIHEKQLSININKRDLLICLNIVIENSCDAIRRLINTGSNHDNLYIKVLISSDSDWIYINIIDNGDPIAPSIKPYLFEYGISSGSNGDDGYGLWRAKSILKDMQGDINLVENQEINSEKNFQIKLPLQRKSIMALVVDDDQHWRNAIIDTLENEGIVVSSAKNYQEAKAIISKDANKIELYILDISLDATNSRNVDGLRLINDIKSESNHASIVLVSAFLEKAKAYQNKITLSIPKTSFKSKNYLSDKLKESGVLS